MTIEEAIKEYQCPGCVSGSNTDCGNFKLENGCENHCPGTIVSYVGKIFLGLPKGFDRKGTCKDTSIKIFSNYESLFSKWGKYDKFNIPVWKYKNKHNHIFIRGLSPRLNRPFLHIILDGKDFGKIECLEITDKDIEGMD